MLGKAFISNLISILQQNHTSQTNINGIVNFAIAIVLMSKILLLIDKKKIIHCWNIKTYLENEDKKEW